MKSVASAALEATDAGSRLGSASDQPLLLTVTETARLLRISRNLCYELIAQKQLPHIRLGRRILLPRYGLEQWISRQAGLPATPQAVISFPPQHHYH